VLPVKANRTVPQEKRSKLARILGSVRLQLRASNFMRHLFLTGAALQRRRQQLL
jgi:hypothetical protein